MSEASDYLSEEEYEVERIVNHRKHAGKLQYFIKWKYYADEDNTWESEDNVYAVDLVQAYWADRGGTDALNAARKGKQFKRRKPPVNKNEEQRRATASTKRTSPESSSTRDESAKRARIEDDAEATTQKTIAKSPSPQLQQPAPNKEYTEVDTAATVRETLPPATDEQLQPPKDATPDEAQTTTSAHIVEGDLPISGKLPGEKGIIAESPSPEERSSLQDPILHEESPVLERLATDNEPSISEVPPAEKELIASEEPRTSEEPPSLDMSPVLEESPAVGGQREVVIPPVHEAPATTDKEPPPRTENETAENISLEVSSTESRQPIADPDIGLVDFDEEMSEWSGGEDHTVDHNTSFSAATVEPELTAKTKDVDVSILDGSDVVDREVNNDTFLTMISDTDEPTVALGEDEILDIIGDDDMAIQQANVLNEQEVQRAMHGSVKSMFEPTEKSLKPINEINSEDVIYDDNFPADPADWVNVKEVVAVTQVPRDTPDSETFIVVRWDNDILSMHPSEQIRTHCARQLINFYEKSLKFVV